MRSLVLAAVGLCLAACSDRKPEFHAGRQGHVDGKKLYEVPDFKLLECRGTPVGKETLQGKVWLASFIFTSCPTHCITMVGEMERLQEEYKDDPDFVLVSSTVDPANDTPEKLKQYAKEHGAKEGRWHFLWGPRALIKKLAHDGMKIAWHPNEPLIHSTYFVLVDRAGWVRGVFNNSERPRMKAMRETIRKVLDESKQAGTGSS